MRLSTMMITKEIRTSSSWPRPLVIHYHPDPAVATRLATRLLMDDVISMRRCPSRSLMTSQACHASSAAMRRWPNMACKACHHPSSSAAASCS